MFSNDVSVSVRDNWIFDRRIFLLSLLVELFPFIINFLSFLFKNLLILYQIHSRRVFISQGLFESLIIDLFKNSLECVQTLLENFMPVSISNRSNNWNEEGECEIFVCFQYCEEIVIFKEAHSPICYLQVWSSYTFDESLEKFVD